jgi:hypothetical protein
VIQHIHHTDKELEALAKHWYTEERGKIVGNTKAWDDIKPHERLNIMDAVSETLEYMEEAWQWETQSSSR